MTKQTKDYLTGLVINTHIMDKIPIQIEYQESVDPESGITPKIFNKYAQDPSDWMAIEKLKRFPTV